MQGDTWGLRTGGGNQGDRGHGHATTRVRRRQNLPGGRTAVKVQHPRSLGAVEETNASLGDVTLYGNGGLCVWRQQSNNVPFATSGGLTVKLARKGGLVKGGSLRARCAEGPLTCTPRCLASFGTERW
jgi:hypothetical protein